MLFDCYGLRVSCCGLVSGFQANNSKPTRDAKRETRNRIFAMYIKTVQLLSFRAHADTTIRFAPKVNLLYGANGAGKTNVLEAIHYLALSKSFLSSKDVYALRKGAPFFEVNGELSGTKRPAFTARIAYVPEEGKRIFVNQAPLEKLSHIVGVIPVVVFAPSDHALTSEGPEVRRRFLNNILSQAKPSYLEDIMQYKRILRQRNVLLTTYRKTRVLARDVLASWDAELISVGSRVILRRQQFINVFKSHMLEAYARIDAAGESPSIAYQTIGAFDEQVSIEQIRDRFAAKLKQVARRELDSGRTLVGPHRDELLFGINELDVRRYASQGQHRTFGMALKLAQYFYLLAELDDVPVLLLDDLFGNLDAARTRVFLELLQTDLVGQSIITAANRSIFDESIDFGSSMHQAIQIEAGAVVETDEYSLLQKGND